jgi:hypothetical protein
MSSSNWNMSTEMICNLGNTQAMMYHAICKQAFQHNCQILWIERNNIFGVVSPECELIGKPAGGFRWSPWGCPRERLCWFSNTLNLLWSPDNIRPETSFRTDITALPSLAPALIIVWFCAIWTNHNQYASAVIQDCQKCLLSSSLHIELYFGSFAEST